MDALEDGLPTRVELVMEELGQSARVDLRCARELRQKGLDLRTEYDSVGQDRVVKWLDTQPVTGQDQLLARTVVEGEREHSVQMT